MRRLGSVDGGQGLVFSGPGYETRLVVDPATSLVHDVTYTSTERKVTATLAAADWTNRLPKVVPAPPRRLP